MAFCIEFESVCLSCLCVSRNINTVKFLSTFLLALLLLQGVPLFGQETLRARVELLMGGKISEKAITEANNLLPEVRASEDPKLVVGLLLWLSSYYTRIGDYERSMELCTEAAAEARETNDVRSVAEVDLQIGNVHFRAGNYERALSTLRPLVGRYKELLDTLEAGKVEANIALNYLSDGKPDAALEQLLLARKTIVAHGEPKDILTIDQNLGALYAQQGRPEQGLSYVRQCLTTILAERDTFGFAPAYGNLAYTFQQLGNFSRAKIYYDSSLYYSRLLKQDATTYVTLQDMADGYQQQGDYKNALKSFREYHDVQASVLGERTLRRIAELEVQHETERKRLALETSEQKILALEQEAQLRSNRMLLVAGGLVSSLLVALLIYLQWGKDVRYRETQKKLIAAELANERLTSGKLSTRLENQREDLTDFALDIERKNRFSKELSDRLYALKKELPPQSRPQLDELIRFTEGHDKLNEHLEGIQENIDQVNHAFHQKLRAAFPKLTASDRVLAGMLRLNMTNKEVATNKGISTASAKMARYRLRKKLNLEPSDDIHIFLREL